MLVGQGLRGVTVYPSSIREEDMHALVGPKTLPRQSDFPSFPHPTNTVSPDDVLSHLRFEYGMVKGQ